MPDQKPATQHMAVSQVRDQLSQLLRKVSQRKRRIIIERRGTPVAAMVSCADLERLNRWDAETARRLEIVARMREPFRGVPTEELEDAEAGAVAEVRAERPVKPARS